MFALVILYVSSLFAGIEMALTVRPINASSLIGGSVQFECGTTLDRPVTWLFNNGSVDYRLYDGGELVHLYLDRFYVDDLQLRGYPRYRPGVYTLYINNTRTSDAGVYKCVDDSGIGLDEAFAELRVGVETVLPIRPQNTTSEIGATIKFTCGTTAQKSVAWVFNNGSEDILLFYNQIVELFIDKMYVRKTVQDNITIYTLVVTNIKISDIGVYKCVGDTGLRLEVVTATMNVEQIVDTLYRVSVWNIVAEAVSLSWQVLVPVSVVIIALLVYRRNVKRHLLTFHTHSYNL